jgi:hypothetical protein
MIRKPRSGSIGLGHGPWGGHFRSTNRKNRNQRMAPQALRLTVSAAEPLWERLGIGGLASGQVQRWPAASLNQQSAESGANIRSTGCLPCAAPLPEHSIRTA